MSYDVGNLNAGQVKVFQWSGAWALKGPPISGANANEKIGANISMSNDGNTIIAGGEGIVRVFNYNSGN